MGKREEVMGLTREEGGNGIKSLGGKRSRKSGGGWVSL